MCNSTRVQEMMILLTLLITPLLNINLVIGQPQGLTGTDTSTRAPVSCSGPRVFKKVDITPASSLVILSSVYTHDVYACCESCLVESSCWSVKFELVTKTCHLYAERVVHIGSEAPSTDTTAVYYWKTEDKCDTSRGYETKGDVSSCIKLHTNLSSWDEARATCQQENGLLFMVDTIEKYNGLHVFLESQGLSEPVCLGSRGFSFISTGEWFWFDGRFVEVDVEVFNFMTPGKCLTVRRYGRISPTNCTIATCYPLCEAPVFSV